MWHLIYYTFRNNRICIAIVIQHQIPKRIPRYIKSTIVPSIRQTKWINRSDSRLNMNLYYTQTIKIASFELLIENNQR